MIRGLKLVQGEEAEKEEEEEEEGRQASESTALREGAAR